MAQLTQHVQVPLSLFLLGPFQYSEHLFEVVFGFVILFLVEKIDGFLVLANAHNRVLFLIGDLVRKEVVIVKWSRTRIIIHFSESLTNDLSFLNFWLTTLAIVVVIAVFGVRVKSSSLHDLLLFCEQSGCFYVGKILSA